MRPCPICGLHAGFHEGPCHEYIRVPKALTRPPGKEAFEAWLAQQREAREHRARLGP